jgi:hypothetical protein
MGLVFLFILLSIYFNLGNEEKQYYTLHRIENARCELFPNRSNGRLIIEARKVRYTQTLNK